MPFFSKQAYKVGEVILAAKPLVHTLLPQLRGKNCHYCLKNLRQFVRCSVCRYFYYCSKECQTSDWNSYHQHECHFYTRRDLKEVLEELGGPFCDTTTLLQMAQVYEHNLRMYCTIKAKPGLMDKPFKLPDGRTRTFKDLMSHEHDMSDDIAQPLMEMGALISHFIEDFDYDLFKSCDYKYRVNGFAIESLNKDHIARGLYIDASIFDHSCYENATPKYDGLHMSVIAKRDIKEGEEITINYLGASSTTMSRQERQKLLKKRYLFTCNCLRCQQEKKYHQVSIKDLLQGAFHLSRRVNK